MLLLMPTVLLSIFAAASRAIQENNSLKPDFTVAVYEYARTSKPKENLLHYQNVTREAKLQGANIIIFPEVGLLPPGLRRSSLPEPIPDPKVAPCNPCNEAKRLSKDSPYLVALSCLAKENSIYISANTIERLPCNSTSDVNCPKDGEYHFNANAVLDSDGNLVAKYRKRFLFFEPQTDPSPKPNPVVFQTPFGRFGVLICFDTIFGEAVDMVENLNPDMVLISTFWFEELPYLLANQYFYSWSLGNGVDIAVSNVHKPGGGQIGSIISNHGHVTYSHYDTPESKLVVSKVHSSVNSIDHYVNSIPQNTPLKFKHTITNFENYTLAKLTEDSSQINICNNGLCCHLKYTTKKLSNDYYFGVFSGVYSIQNHYYVAQQVCTMFACSEITDNKCTTIPTTIDTVFSSVNIEGNMTTRHIYPSVLGSNVVVVPKSKWSYTKGVGRIETGIEVDMPLISVNLFGRLYDQDPPYKP